METIFQDNVQAYLIIVLLLLNIVFGIWLWRVTSHYNRLIKSADKKTLTKLLESLQKTLSIHEKRLKNDNAQLKKIAKDNKSNLQNISLKRFNPFSNTGGDQSFILSILDGYKNGVVITSLHSRENTRFYIKSVTGGVGDTYSLSADEQKVINSGKRK